MNVRALAITPDAAVIKFVGDHELRITKTWLASQFAIAPGETPAEKRDAMLAALRETFVDPEMLNPERLWVDFEDDGTIRAAAVTREGGCPFNNDRWAHRA
jgi:hypothetical protein